MDDTIVGERESAALFVLSLDVIASRRRPLLQQSCQWQRQQQQQQWQRKRASDHHVSGSVISSCAAHPLSLSLYSNEGCKKDRIVGEMGRRRDYYGTVAVVAH